MSDFEDHSNSGGGKRKRNRKPVTCARCRETKVKCDRNSPCSACKEKGEECIWEGAIRLPHSNYSRDQEALELRSQLDRLENIISMLHSSAEQEDDDELESFNEAIGEARNSIAGSSSNGRIYQNDGERSAAEALGLLAATAQAPRSQGSSPITSSPSTIDQLINLLPQKEQLDILVEHFLAEDMSEFPIVSVTSFRQRYDNFSIFNASKDPFFVALLFSIAAWTIHWDSLDPRNSKLKQKDGIVSTYFATSMQILTVAGYMSNPSLDCVRTLFMNFHYQTIQNSPTARFTLTSAIQVAQAIGLNYDPATYTQSVVECEERRRIWTLLISTDWITSLSNTYICSATQCNTALPANVHESNITEQGVVIQPLTCVTPVLSLLLKTSIAIVARKITETCFSFNPPSWQKIQDLNSELCRIDSNLPQSLAYEWANGAVKPFPEVLANVDLVRVHVHLHLRQQFIRLHRPFLTRGFSDARFSYSRDKCCWAARYILAIHRGLGIDFRATRDWAITHHALNALIILVIDLLQDPNGSFAEMHHSDVRSSLQIIDSIQNPTPIIEETLEVLRILLGKIFSRVEISKKRKLDALAPPAPAIRAGHQNNTSLDNSDLAYLLSTTQNPSSAFRTRSDHQVVPANQPRLFDPSVPFSKPLPLPTSIDPIHKTIALNIPGYSVYESEYLNLWSGLNKFSNMYSVPDLIEWKELSKVGMNEVAWSEGIDLLH